MNKPEFDPSKPFEYEKKPEFDPSKPFEYEKTPGIGDKIMSGLEWINERTGAPTRQALATLQDTGDIGQSIEAFKKQYGENADNVPSGEEIAKKAGLSDTFKIPLPTPLAAVKNITTGSPTVTPAGLAGQAIELGADWTNAIPLGSLTKLGAKGIEKGAELAGKIPSIAKGIGSAVETGENVATKLGKKAITGTLGPSQEAIEAYLKAGPEVKGVSAGRESIEALKDSLDKTLMPYTEKVIEAEKALDNAKVAHVGNIDKLKIDLDNANEQLKIAKDRALGAGGASLSSAVKKQNELVSELSGKSFDLLDEGGIIVKTPSIKGAITKEINTLEKKAVTDEQVKIVDTLKRYRDNLDKFGKEMSGRDAKELIQAMDREIEYLAPNSVGRASPIDKGLFEIRSSVDSRLKKYEPYSEAMSTLSEETKKLKNVSDYSSEQSAINAIKQTTRPEGVEKLRAMKDLGFNPDIYTNETRLPEYLQKSGTENALKQAILRRQMGIEAAQQGVHAAEESRAPFKALAPNEYGKSNAQAAIVNQLRGERSNIDLERIINKIDETHGTNYSKQLELMRAAAPFEKEFRQGSANTNFFSIVGGALGGLMGLPTGLTGTAAGISGGALAGGTFGKLVVDKYGPSVARKILDAAPKLEKMRPSTWIESLEVPSNIKQELFRELAEASAMAPIGISASRLGNEDVKRYIKEKQGMQK